VIGAFVDRVVNNALCAVASGVVWLVEKLDMETDSRESLTGSGVYPSGQPTDVDSSPVVAERTSDHSEVAAAGGHDTTLGDHCVCSHSELMHDHVLSETRFCIGCEFACIQYRDCDCDEQLMGEVPGVDPNLLRSESPIYQRLIDENHKLNKGGPGSRCNDIPGPGVQTNPMEGNASERK